MGVHRGSSVEHLTRGLIVWPEGQVFPPILSQKFSFLADRPGVLPQSQGRFKLKGGQNKLPSAQMLLESAALEIGRHTQGSRR
jgi:hypothetical protein